MMIRMTLPLRNVVSPPTYGKLLCNEMREESHSSPLAFASRLVAHGAKFSLHFPTPVRKSVHHRLSPIMLIRAGNPVSTSMCRQ